MTTIQVFLKRASPGDWREQCSNPRFWYAGVAKQKYWSVIFLRWSNQHCSIFLMARVWWGLPALWPSVAGCATMPVVGTQSGPKIALKTLVVAQGKPLTVSFGTWKNASPVSFMENWLEVLWEHADKPKMITGAGNQKWFKIEPCGGFQEESPLPGVSRWILKPGSYKAPTTGLSMNILEMLSEEGGFNHIFIY